MRSGKVTFKGLETGTLEETLENGSRFIYSPSCTTQIACAFPLTQREHEWSVGIHPFFQHLAPEGWLREKQARVANLAQEDDLGLLLRYGSDCIGAVGIEDPSNLEHPFGTEAATRASRTVSGVQRKLLVVKSNSPNLYHPAESSGPAPYIAKFNSAELQTLVQNENLSLKWLTTALGEGEVTKFELASIEGHDQAEREIALVVERFDRTQEGEKLRLEDFAQILNIPKGQDYAGKYDASYEDIAEAIKKHSSRPAIDLSRYFKRLVAFAVIGNADAHLKNFSLLETEAGLRLSPAYDVVNTVIYKSFDPNFALRLAGNYRPLGEINKAELGKFGKEIGLPEASITIAFEELTRNISKANSPLQSADERNEFLARYAENVLGNTQRILGG